MTEIRGGDRSIALQHVVRDVGLLCRRDVGDRRRLVDERAAPGVGPMGNPIAIAGQEFGMGLLEVAVLVMGDDVAAGDRIAAVVGGRHLGDVHPLAVHLDLFPQDVDAVVVGPIERTAGGGIEEDLHEADARRPAAHLTIKIVHQHIPQEIGIGLIGGIQRPVRLLRHAEHLQRTIAIRFVPEFDPVAFLRKGG